MAFALSDISPKGLPDLLPLWKGTPFGDTVERHTRNGHSLHAAVTWAMNEHGMQGWPTATEPHPAP